VAAWCASEATHFTTAAGLEHNPTVRLGYRGQASTELSLSEIVRGANGPATLPQGTQESALQVARSLESLADSMEAAASSVSRARFHDSSGAEYVEDLALEEQRVNRFTSLARELACTLADHDALPAPGTSAAVRRTVRGGLPLAPRERHSLLETLRIVDDAQRWPTVVERLNTLARALAPRHSDTPAPVAAPRAKKAPKPSNPNTNNNPNPERQDPA
jgi:hypothetical protein